MMRRGFVALIALAVLLTSDLKQVWAHARLLRSEPKDDAVLAEAPRSVHLWFNELLDRGFHSIEVYPAAERGKKQRANFIVGPAEVDPEDRTHLRVLLKPLPPGDYVVEYRVLSRDGHTAPGRISFRVTKGP